MQITHSSVVSAVLVAKAAPNADMSLIWLNERLESRYVNNGPNNKSQHAHNSLQLCQRDAGGQGRSQRRYVADLDACETARPSCKKWAQ